eukprot:g27120.t1
MQKCIGLEFIRCTWTKSSKARREAKGTDESMGPRAQGSAFPRYSTQRCCSKAAAVSNLWICAKMCLEVLEKILDDAWSSFKLHLLQLLG